MMLRSLHMIEAESLSARLRMTYRFRLTFNHRVPGFFGFEEKQRTFSIGDHLELTLTARNADKLSEASRFHFEGGGFPDEDTARGIAERLRLRLRVLNALLDLGLSVPAVDKPGLRVSDHVKGDVIRKTGATVVDSMLGVMVFPDDGSHFEYDLDGRVSVSSGDPEYLFRAIGQVWPVEMQFDARASDAIEILNMASKEASPRAKFLLTYLSLERLVERKKLSKNAENLIKSFREQIFSSDLDEQERKSLDGSLGRLRFQSFPNAVMAWVDRIVSPGEINGKPLRILLKEFISVRNKIAHDATLDPDTDLNSLSMGGLSRCPS